MKAGSVFIYTGSVLHGGGTNTTEETRLGIFLHYAPSVVEATRESISLISSRSR